MDMLNLTQYETCLTSIMKASCNCLTKFHYIKQS